MSERVILNIHAEDLQKASTLSNLEDTVIKHNGKAINIVLSLIPEEVKHLGNALIAVQRIVSEPNVILGQHGYSHKCGRHRFRDNNHENRCPYGHVPFEKQRSFMGDGRKLLEDAFGERIFLYGAPNHLSDESTPEISSELEIPFMSDLALIGLRPYKHRSGTIIIPESKINHRRDTEMVYLHDFELPKFEKELKLLRREGLYSLLDVKPEEESGFKIGLNEALKHGWKNTRDMAKLARLSLQGLANRVVQRKNEI